MCNRASNVRLSVRVLVHTLRALRLFESRRLDKPHLFAATSAADLEALSLSLLRARACTNQVAVRARAATLMQSIQISNGVRERLSANELLEAILSLLLPPPPLSQIARRAH